MRHTALRAPLVLARASPQAGAVPLTGLQDGHALRTGLPRGLTAVRLDDPSDPETGSTRCRTGDVTP